MLYSVHYFVVKTKMTGFFQTAFYFGYTLMFCLGEWPLRLLHPRGVCGLCGHQRRRAPTDFACRHPFAAAAACRP